jgi:HD-GYP domain-containing protein (c-di-GMP phosphodiesterase class II)
MARKATYKELEQRVKGLEKKCIERKTAEEELKENNDKLEKNLDEFIQLIAFISELNDPFSAGHQGKATQLACAIAKEMDLSEKQLKGIYIASRIQNIGKIKLPTEMLIKPDRLTEAELNIIQTHPQAGYELLKPIEFQWPIAQIVLQHHEKLDGSGYPAGLQDKEILLEAKIIGVADVVEAMCSSRSYRPALNQEKAIEEISRNKGTLYDARIVEACLKVLTDKGFKF